MSPLPAWLRRPLRRGFDLVSEGRYSPLRPAIAAARFHLRLSRLRRTLARLEDASAPEQLDLELMERIVLAWGNPGWTGDAGFLLALARSVWSGKGPVLDCGSGLSTLVAAGIAARQGVTVWSLEQDERWCHDMRRVLTSLHVGNVILWYAPLRSYGDYVWYDLDGRNLPSRFATVSCDGPSVRKSVWAPPLFQGWRVGVVLVLRDLGISFDRILLDDASDPRAPGLLARWEDSGIMTETADTPTGQYIVGHPGTRAS